MTDFFSVVADEGYLIRWLHKRCHPDIYGGSIGREFITQSHLCSSGLIVQSIMNYTFLLCMLSDLCTVT